MHAQCMRTAPPPLLPVSASGSAPVSGNMIFDETETDQLSGARYWPKMGCDEHGRTAQGHEKAMQSTFAFFLGLLGHSSAARNNCLLGGSGGPGQHCVEASLGKPKAGSFSA